MNAPAYRSRLAALLSFTLLSAAPLRAQQEAGEPTVDLEEAIRRALALSPLMVQAEGDVRTAEIGRRSAIAAFLPTLSMSSGASLSSTERYNPQTNTAVTGSNDSYNAGLNASVDLFTGGRKTAELRNARTQLEAAEAGARERRFSVTLATKQAYFDVLRGDELIELAQTGIRRAQESLEAAETRLAVGSATRSDVLRARLALNEAQQTLLQARNQRRVAAFGLGRLVGVEGPVGARPLPPADDEPIPVPRQELLTLTLEQSPTVEAAEAGVRSADATVSAARAQWFPSLRASSGYSWFNQDPALSGGRTSWSLSLGLSYPLFNGLQREGNIARTHIQADVARAQLTDSRRQAVVDLERLIGALELAAERTKLAAEAVAVAEEDLRVQRERYRLGATTIIELLTSENSLVQAETDAVSARYDYQIARAELEALVGREL